VPPARVPTTREDRAPAVTGRPRAPWPLRALDALAARPRLAVALAAALPFLLTLGNPPILDDGWAALDNPLTWSLANVGRIFQELYGFAGEPSVRGPYRPITTLSYALDYAVHGRWPPGYHAVNVGLHVVASLLVLALARRLAAAALPGQAARVAVLCGLLFAVHPAHVEAVATIFGRTEPLSTAFAVGALLLALRRREGRWRLPAALGLLVLGVLSKEVAIVTPGLFVVVAVALPAAAGLEVRPGLGRGAPRRALLEVAAVAALLLGAFVPYLVGRGPALAVAAEARWFPVGTPGLHVALTMSRVMGEYLRILAVPGFLGGDFAYAARLPTLSAPTPGFAVATAAWLATAVAALLLRRRAPLAAAGLAWIFLPLLPVMHLIPVGVLLAERLLYLPSVGFCLAVAAAAGHLLEAAGPSPLARVPAGGAGRAALAGGSARPSAARPSAALLAAALLAALLVLTTRTVVRTLDWRSDVAYWTSELEKAPREPVVNNNLAVAYLARRDYPRAVERLRVVLEVHPRYWRAHINLAIAQGELGDRAAARLAFRQALALAPGSADPRFYFARWLEQVGEREEALALLAEARALRPDEARLPLLQGEVLLELGRVEEARPALERAAAIDPKDRRARALLDGLPPTPAR
jgi:protein O-mannosyl-transferase